MFSVAILLSTFNGEKYLPDLLKSLKCQTHKKFTIFVIDDGSRDETVKILNSSSLDIIIFKTKGKRDPVKNFIELLYLVPKKFDFYCFCDQDDYWLKNKISYSIKKLKLNKANILGTRTFITDKSLKIKFNSKLFTKPSFENSLVQSIAGGNTLFWDSEFHNFICNLKTPYPASHDWYLYQVSQLYSFKFIFICRPTLLYRQHNNNVVGSNQGLINFLRRIYLGLKGNYKNWHEMNKNHLLNVDSTKRLDRNNLFLAQQFYYFRGSSNSLKALKNIFFKYKIRRQSLIDNIILLIAILIYRI